MECKGRNLDDHCCYVRGKPCKWLEENAEQGFRWSCKLRRTLGSWEAVMKSSEYWEEPGNYFATKNLYCNTYPDKEQYCDLCKAGE